MDGAVQGQTTRVALILEMGLKLVRVFWETLAKGK
jgi:hypothetical protein